MLRLIFHRKDLLFFLACGPLKLLVNAWLIPAL